MSRTTGAGGRAADPAAAPQGLLNDALGALDQAGLPYCQLRGDGGGRGRQREIDLLVAAPDLGRFERIVSRLGLERLRTWGHGGHRFFVGFDRDAGRWLKLDVVTSLRYGGPSRPFITRAFAGFLDRRVRAGETWRPDPGDAALGLALHAVLDKRSFKGHHREELRRLREIIDCDPARRAAAATRFQQALGGALGWPELSDTIVAGTWDRLLAKRRRLALEIFRRDPAGCARLWLVGHGARLVRPLLVLFGRKGFSVALMGPDGAGKTTLARALAADPQIRARVVYMGSNVSQSTLGLRSTGWIERQRKSPGRGNARLVRPLAYGNRLLEQAYRSLGALALRLRGRFVVFDRHPYELLVSETPKGRGARWRRRLLRMASPRPDLVLVLDVPPEVLRARKQEHSLEWLARQRERYRSLRLAVRGAVLLDTSDSEEGTVRLATEMIWNRYRRRVAHFHTLERDGSGAGRRKNGTAPSQEEVGS